MGAAAAASSVASLALTATSDITKGSATQASDDFHADRARRAAEFGQVQANLTDATGRKLTIAAWYVENESGAKLARPELFRLLADAHPGDVLLVEQVDRVSRLTTDDWERLKSELTARRVRVVALDLPTSWMMASGTADEFTGRMFEAINGMLLDMLAAVARKDYVDRRRRQAQVKPKRRQKGSIGAARKMLIATTGLPACLRVVSLGDQSKA
jgi:DNA invertase Pin-like site-specific DNA recombinase